MSRYGKQGGSQMTQIVPGTDCEDGDTINRNQEQRRKRS